MGLTAAGLALVPEWALPALAQGEVDVPFTDFPANFVTSPADGARRTIDLRKIDGLITPADQFFFIQHYDKPQLDKAAYRLKLTGLVAKPIELSLADLQSMRAVDVVNGYECSGNSPRGMQGLSSCGRFTGVRLRDVLRRAGVDDKAREVVFFGADKGAEDVVFRQNTLKVQQQFGRSITLDNAMKPEPLLAWSLNGQPLDRDHGFPLRVIMPGWYGVANVKWLSEIHLQENRLPRQVPGTLVPHRPRGRRHRRADRSGNTVRGSRSVEAECEVGDRARAEVGRRPHDPRLRPQRRHTAPVGRGQGGRGPVATSDARSGQH